MTAPRSLLLALAGLFCSTVCAGQGKDPAAATALFKRGREALQAGDYATACPRFKESTALDPKVGTLMNLADCEEHLHQPADAWAHWLQARDRASADGDDRLAEIKDRFEKIDKSVAKLTLQLDPGSPPGTSIQRDNVALESGAFGVPLPVNPGKHVVRATAAGWEESVTEITLVAGETRQVTISLKAKQSDALSATDTPSSSLYLRGDSAPSSTRHAVGWVFLGTGAVSLGVGTVAGVIALNKQSFVANSGNCPAKFCNASGVSALDDGRTMSHVSTVGFVAGALFTGVGLYMLLTDDAKSSVGLLTTPGGAGGMVTVRF